MFNYNESFFKKALDYGIIVSNEVQKTSAMISTADALWEKEIRNDAVLKSKFKGQSIDPAHISETTITECDHLGNTAIRPIVDLVQQGGGMYGIALLGYSYIMERAGIRFHSHGGTSAGAINASFLAAVPNTVYQQPSMFSTAAGRRQANKSEILTHIIANTDFSRFMDRDGILGFLQKTLFKNYRSLWLWLPILLFAATFLLGIYFAFSLVFNTANGLTGSEIRVYDFIIGTFNVLAFALFCYFLLIRALGPNFGINTGNAYYEWVDTLLHLLHIHNTKELNSRLQESAVPKANGSDGKTKPWLVLMAANLTHNKVVKLPEEAGDYWANPWNINPAAYLRATMSLPFIFKVLIPDMGHYDIFERTNKVLTEAKFVDGGLLSNFPIREFHRTDGKMPLFPTFGVLLSSREPVQKEAEKHSLGSFIGSFFRTFRNFYDNDFLVRNTETKLLVELVNTTKYNWLNFWMTDAEKQGLFKEGAKAAIRQLRKFDWQQYKQERKKEENLTKFH